MKRKNKNALCIPKKNTEDEKINPVVPPQFAATSR